VEDDPQAALAHARAARDRASRVAAVREAVGVAAYHAGDYAEAARELRAYRRMSGDHGYRAVLADCERAMGRPDVALRLVAEALAEKPDAEETAELRIVESGARLDLGEDAAARLVLEAELGGRPDPAMLQGADTSLLRIASAYADLLQSQGQEDAAAEWLTAIAAADPEDLVGAVDRLGIEFTEVELDLGDIDLVDEGDEASEVGPTAPERVEELPEDDHGLGLSFDQEVEAEVAELLGETEPAGTAEPGTDAPEHDEH
jgi:tetratricopeptide (TPR) repeat protein